MSLYAITREAGPDWTDGKGAFEQPGVADHSAFMNGLVRGGLRGLRRPARGTEQDRIRVLLIVEADSEDDVRRRLADDPWERERRVVTTLVEPWMLMVGAERLVAQSSTL